VVWRWARGLIIGVRVPAGAGNFSLHHRVQTGWGPTQPPVQWVPGAVPLGKKLPGREADNSPQSSVEVKNEWSYTSTPQYAFIAWYSAKSQGQLYLFTF
jgi:hypothetical protein